MIRVYGIPKGQPRVRACVRGKHAAVYDPGTADDWKATVHAAAHAYFFGGDPIEGPVWASMVFLMPRPKRLLTKKSPTGRIRYIAKPDRDNLEKAVLDTLTQLGVWHDDSQVCDGPVSKWYVAIGEKPGCEIEIRGINDADSP